MLTQRAVSNTNRKQQKSQEVILLTITSTKCQCAFMILAVFDT